MTFFITFECKVRYQKFKSLNRSKFYPTSESLIKIYVSPPGARSVYAPGMGISIHENIESEVSQ